MSCNSCAFFYTFPVSFQLDRGTLYYKCQKRIIVDIEPSQSNPPPEADPEWRKYIQDENERNEIFVSMHSSAQGTF